MTEPTRNSSYRFGTFELQPSERRLLAGGEPVVVGPRAFDLLVALVERPGQLVTKEELLDSVWPKLVVEENNLQVQVSALRKILGQEAIATIPGRGYRFTVTLTDSDAAGSSPTSSPRNNLPHPLTRFVGREVDLDECAGLLDENRLLTLTGIGGCGKTRLAIKLAERMLPSFPDGVWFVDLAPVAEAGRVALAVATTLGVREEMDKPLEETLKRHLAGEMLLVLDNCEHLLGACAALVEPLLMGAPGLRALVTSREGLGVAGERTVTVRSLSFPSLESAQDLETLAGFEAVRLFADRAKQVAPEFTLSPTNAPAVVEICRRLDGIPLALELAAARVRLLSTEQIRAKLDDRFHLLTGGSRTISRHQTLLATLQWSYEHLTPDEQRLLQRLSVFVDGCTLGAAAAVAGQGLDELEVLERLERLVDKSLVLVDRRATESRYKMLETVRQYAQDRLNDSGQSNAVREQHLAHFLSFAKIADADRFTEKVGQWLEKIGVELPNLLAAHAWCDRAQDGANRGLELATNLRPYWLFRGLYALGQQVYDEALGRKGIDPRSMLRARTLCSLGHHNYFRGRITEIIAPTKEALSIAREHGDDEWIVNCLDKIALALGWLGDSARALECAEEQLAIARKIGASRLIGRALTTKGEICRAQGDFDAASEAYEQALPLFSQHDLVERSWGLHNVARVSMARGQLSRAREMLAQSFRLIGELGLTSWDAVNLVAASHLAAACGDWQRAARFQGAADAAEDKMGRIRNAYDDRISAKLREKALAMLGTDTYAAAYNTGHGLSLEEALAQALVWFEEKTEFGPAEHGDLLALLPSATPLRGQRGKLLF